MKALIIGGGLAGERCAIEAAVAGHDALILSLVPPRRSHSCAAQGGMQAALANCVKAEGDSPTVHFLDTVRGSDWGADQELGCNGKANGAVTARATTLMHDLDRELRKKTSKQHNLDDVMNVLARQKQKISISNFEDTVRQFLGQESAILKKAAPGSCVN